MWTRANCALLLCLLALISSAPAAWAMEGEGEGEPFCLDSFTEWFEVSGTHLNDLRNTTLTLTPADVPCFYTACTVGALTFPADPSLGTALTLDNDDFVEVVLSEGKQAFLYGVGYDRLFVGSNGYVTFGQGDTTFQESAANHFSLPRISGFFYDLAPNIYGHVSFQELDDRAVVTFLNVLDTGLSLIANFQIELFFDGVIRITWLWTGGAVSGGLAGISPGGGTPPDFVQSDLTAYPHCPGIQDPLTDLEGVWVGYETGDPETTWTITVTEARLSWVGPDEEIRGIFSLNRATTPNTIDVFIEESSTVGSVGLLLLGIFEQFGDRMTIAFSVPGSIVRPAAFEPGDTTRVFAFTRVVSGEGEGEGEPPSFTLSVNASPPGTGAITVAPQQDSYAPETVVSLLAEAAQGWQFSRWLGEAADPQAAETSVMMDKDISVTAVFVPVGSEGEGEGEGEEDPDGDGLTNAQEQLYLTDPENPDSDGDGMSDGWEVEYGLAPLNSADAAEDRDSDGVSNFDEFLQGTDPTDASDPASVYFVSPRGLDVPEGGTLVHPWRTVGFAQQVAVKKTTRDITLVLLPGEYRENVTLRERVTLTAFDAGNATISGRVTGADGTTLSKIEIHERGGDLPAAKTATPLLAMDDVTMKLVRVTFRGGTARLRPGIVVSGQAPGTSLITDCTFTSLSTGINIYGTAPVIRRCYFNDLSGDAIVLRDQGGGKADGDNPIGDAGNPNTGYNTFEDIDGYGVNNERSETVLAQECDWGTDEPDDIADMVHGNVDTGYALKSGTGLFPGSIICTVWSAATKARIRDASVKAAPGSYAPVTENSNGVYLLAAVSPNTYTMTVSASSFLEGAKTAAVGPGDTASLVFPMAAATEGEGEGEGCGCLGGAVSPDGADFPNGAADDLLVTGLTGLSLFLAARRRPTRSNG